MTTPATLLTVIAEESVLPGRDKVAAAAIDVDLATGKIIAIRDVLEAEDGVQRVTVPKGKVLLPGLIEWVNNPATLTAAPMCISASPTVKALPVAPGHRCPVESPQ